MTSLHFGEALLEEGWTRDVRMTLADGMIARIERAVAPAPGDQRHGAGLPGLPNLHSHAFQRGMAGMAERRGASADSFWTWREVMYRFLDRLSPDHLMAIAALAYAEMLESGFTRVGEFHYLHHDPAGQPYADPAAMAAAIAEAARQSGIGLTLLPVFYAHSGFGGQPPSESQRRFITSLDSFNHLREASRAAIADLPGAVLGLAPHSLRAVTGDQLSALSAMGQGGPIHIHVAEQRREVEDCLTWSGARPVEWLLDHAEVGPDWCLVHATHMNEAETLALAKTGAVAGLCPITEANLGDGLFPAPAFIAAGGAFGVGSDSNVAIDAAEELRWLEYGQRLNLEGRNVLTPEAGTSSGAFLFGQALRGGAQALGAPATLAEGHSADIVTLDTAHPSLIGAAGEALLDRWIFAAPRGAVDCVWRHGRQVVSQGRHVARDAIAARYGAVLREVLA